MPLDLSEPRPSLTPAAMQALENRFRLVPAAEPRDLGGSFSLNVLVETAESRFVARVYGTETGPARLRAIQRVRRHLGAGGVPAPEQVLTTDGQPFVDMDGHLLEVERYVEHNANMDTWHRLEIGLPYLGRVHTLLRTLQIGAAGRRAPVANHIEPDRALAGTLRGAARMRSWNPTPEELELASAAEDLARLVHEAERDAVSHLPRQMVHGDFWDNNVLFHHDQVVLVTDLGFMAERLRVDDLALTLFFASATIGGEYLSEERMLQLRRLVDAYDSGLTEPLTPAERRAIPAAIARQPLWSMGWWVPALPDVRQARRHAASRAIDVQWALGLMRNLQAWQEAFLAG